MTKYILVMNVQESYDKGKYFHNFVEEVNSEAEGREQIKNFAHYAWLGRRTGIPKFCLGLYKQEEGNDMQLITCLSNGVEDNEDSANKSAILI